MLKARKNKALTWLLFKYCRWLFRRRFSKVVLVGDESALRDQANFPIVLMGNHRYWYDGLLETLLMSRYRLDYYVMMEEKNLRRYWYFRYCGVFGVNLDLPGERSKALLYTVRLLKEKNSRRAVFIFPHGELVPMDLPAPPLREGASWLLQKGEATGIPYVKYIRYGEGELPEAYIYLGERFMPGNNIQTGELEERLREMEQTLQSYVKGESCLPILNEW